MEQTIFHKILAGQIPATVVYEDDHVLAFKDINPKAPVHVLVIPKVELSDFTDIRSQTEATAAGFFRGISLCAQKLGLEENGYRVVFNTRADGGQEVPYLHAHILAGRRLTWPPG